MTTTTLSNGNDTWIGSGNPSANHGNAASIQVGSPTGKTIHALVYFKMPFEQGATITSATLYLTAAKSYTKSGSPQLQKAVTTQSWAAHAVTWNNKPNVGPYTGVALPSLSNGETIQLDVTADVQSFASGTTNYGWSIATTANDTLLFHSFNSNQPPVLLVEFSTPPDPPTGLSPINNVSAPLPVITFDYSDADGDALSAVRVKADPNGQMSAPVYDSGWTPSVVPQFDLTAASGTLNVSSGDTITYEVAVRDDSGVDSDFSDSAQYTYVPLPEVAFLSPSASNPFVGDHTPTLVWEVTAGSQQQFRAEILAADNHTVLADSGWQLDTTQSWQVPPHVIQDGVTYYAVVHVGDGVERQTASNAPGKAIARQAFTFQAGTAVAPVITNAYFTPAPPENTLVFTDTGADTFTIYRDGKVVAAGLLPGDLLVGSSYQWIDRKVKIGTTHTYQIRAVISGVSSLLSTDVEVTAEAPGIWVIAQQAPEVSEGRPLTNQDLPPLWFVLAGTDSIDQLAMTDSSTTYSPIGGNKQVVVTQGIYGLAGQITGLLYDRVVEYGRTCEDMEADARTIRGMADKRVRLIFGRYSLPVVLSAFNVSPASFDSTGARYCNVSFNFVQDGELDPVSI